ncbi:hypothetical protein D9619_004593 [Psilocybe cf. subviscida]|uniref:Uncharacterized protein n=1 Tax=Psilocybe cf. subviscida TaxID=2480587 RepID=A0A8H5F8R0_9AGAR|nr:hypothetical protein D9619_004593 [Psilocybe cf. subviscida]
MPTPPFPTSPRQAQTAHHQRDRSFAGHSSCGRVHRVHSLWNVRAKFIQGPRILYCAIRDQQTWYDQHPVIVVEWIVVQGLLGNINQGFQDRLALEDVRDVSALTRRTPKASRPALAPAARRVVALSHIGYRKALPNPATAG